MPTRTSPQPDGPEPPLLFRTTQVAAKMQISVRKVEELVASGQLRSLKVGKLRRIPAAAVDEFIESQLEQAS